MADHENDVLQQAIGLSRKVGPLFSWCDNYDLLVCTPNGRRETQCMAIKFMCQPAGDILPGSANVGESPSTPLIILRPKKFAAANLDVKNLSPVTLLNYTGPKKVKSPRLSNNFGQPFEDVCKLEESLARAHLITVYELVAFTPLQSDRWWHPMGVVWVYDSVSQGSWWWCHNWSDN